MINFSSTNYVEVSFKQSSKLVYTSHIKLDQEVVIVIHGYESNADEVFIVNIIESLIETFGDNKSYCALNWKVEASAYIGPIAQPIKKLLGIKLLGIDYFPVSLIAAGVGSDLGKALLELKSSGVQMNNIYLMGHSEGAHLAGAAGRVVISSEDLIGR
ncbi:unnamed protein product [Arctia plantaginis]|uniref:Uncharacterized protein n=1 Tax=Arctia plantaginis TaxID=874455 RepID=A0A8S0YXS3_ARCPL|nr:unnamed protein product [Arctia plantaginis]